MNVQNLTATLKILNSKNGGTHKNGPQLLNIIINFPNWCAAVDMISTEIVYCTGLLAIAEAVGH